MPAVDRTRPGRTNLLPVHDELLTFFAEPQCISLTDIAERLGYDRETVRIRIKELVAMKRLKRTRYPHVWAKPNQYETKAGI